MTLPDVRTRAAQTRRHTTAQADFLVAVAGVEGLFATKTGGQPSSAVSRSYDGGAVKPEVLTAPAVPEDLVVRRPYKPLRDAPICKALRPRIRSFRTTVTVTPTDADKIPIAAATLYQCTLIGVSEPEVNASSGDPAEMELRFAVEEVV